VNGERTEEMPAANLDLAKVEPVFENLPGWRSVTRGMTSLNALPIAARRYLDFLEEKTEVEVGCVSLGPERSETIIVPGSRLEKLLR
jgi:adenylosuccinate synthase